jgi:F0F1-type ATP synthase epsilon subunit
VKIPGMDGEYGVTAGHTPIISQLKPGVVAIMHEAVRQRTMRGNQEAQFRLAMCVR